MNVDSTEPGGFDLYEAGKGAGIAGHSAVSGDVQRYRAREVASAEPGTDIDARERRPVENERPRRIEGTGGRGQRELPALQRGIGSKPCGTVIQLYASYHALHVRSAISQ